jgi:hypothetical protein
VWQQLYAELKDRNFMVVAVAEESRGADHARQWIEAAKSDYAARTESNPYVCPLPADVTPPIRNRPAA